MIKLTGFEGFDVARLLCYHVTTSRIAGVDSSIGTVGIRILKLLQCVFLRRVRFVNYRNRATSKVLVMRFSNSTQRKDIVNLLEGVARTIPHESYDDIGWEWCKQFNIVNFFIKLWLIVRWYGQLKQGSIPLTLRLQVMGMLCDLIDMKCDLLNYVNTTKYKLAFVFYDAPFYLNFLIQYMKIQGCVTATLQHGVMLAKRPKFLNILDFCGVEFESSVSDYYLAWNDFTRSEAIKAGWNSDRVLVLGNAKCLTMEPLPSSGYRVIGLILDGICEAENNLPMIQMVDDYARTHHYKYILRFHPNDDPHTFDDVRDNSISSVCCKTTSLRDFLVSVEFCVVANSTVLFELEYYHVPFVRYACGTDKDKFKDYPSFDFSNSIQLAKSIASMREYSSQKRDIPSNNIDNYVSFFKQYI